MQFTGKNLAFLYTCVDGHISSLKAHIGSCPDVIEYEDDILAYEMKIMAASAFKTRITKALKEEGYTFEGDD